MISKIKKLFKTKVGNPIYSGFGNKDTDAISYLSAGVRKELIFTISDNGTVYKINDSKTTSMKNIINNNHLIFPIFNEYEFYNANDQNVDKNYGKDMENENKNNE